MPEPTKFRLIPLSADELRARKAAREVPTADGYAPPVVRDIRLDVCRGCKHRVRVVGEIHKCERNNQALKEFTSIPSAACPADKWPAHRTGVPYVTGTPVVTPPPRDLILRCDQAPGDVVVMTAVVRDLHRAHPGRFRTAVAGTGKDLWANNPLLTPADQLSKDAFDIKMSYGDQLDKSNDRPYHFITGMTQELERRLGVRIPTTAFKGDLYLTDAERAVNPVKELTGHAGKYWLVAAGGKYDYTTKWWSPLYYQQVVDHFKGRITFVRVGAKRSGQFGVGHWHPPLEGCIDLVDRTPGRTLLQAVYHCEGVLCPITLLMHLAAAVPTRPDAPTLRPAVVVAGGREGVHWESYPGQAYLHTIGRLPCCQHGGCWVSRCQLVGDGDKKDKSPCPLPVRAGDVVVPKCMAMIRPRHAIEAIESWYEGGTLTR